MRIECQVQQRRIESLTDILKDRDEDNLKTCDVTLLPEKQAESTIVVKPEKVHPSYNFKLQNDSSNKITAEIAEDIEKISGFPENIYSHESDIRSIKIPELS
eukprot:236182_1